jgi:hypothetical protein
MPRPPGWLNANVQNRGGKILVFFLHVRWPTWLSVAWSIFPLCGSTLLSAWLSPQTRSSWKMQSVPRRRQVHQSVRCQGGYLLPSHVRRDWQLYSVHRIHHRYQNICFVERPVSMHPTRVLNRTYRDPSLWEVRDSNRNRIRPIENPLAERALAIAVRERDDDINHVVAEQGSPGDTYPRRVREPDWY